MPSVLPLVFGAAFHPVGGRDVGMQHVRVVEDETAQREDERYRRRGHAARRTVKRRRAK
jgi:hypothetical protein